MPHPLKVHTQRIKELWTGVRRIQTGYTSSNDLSQHQY